MIDDQCFFFTSSYEKPPPGFIKVSVKFVFLVLLWDRFDQSSDSVTCYEKQLLKVWSSFMVVLSLLCRWQSVHSLWACHSLCLCRSLICLVSVPKTHHCRPPGCPQHSLPFFLSPLRPHLLRALLPHVPSLMLHCCFLDCHQFREQWTLRTCESIQSSPTWCRVPPPAPRPQCQCVSLGVRLRGLKAKVTFPVW